MNEAERCDRISLMHAGKVLTVGTPRELVEARHASSLEEAFIAYLQDADGSAGDRTDLAEAAGDPPAPSGGRAPGAVRAFDPGRLWAYARRESVEIARDPLRLAFALLGPMILMITFGYGISFDVEHLAYAAFDQDRSLESRELLEGFEGSRYFDRRGDITSPGEIETRLRSGELALVVEVPPRFGRDLLTGRTPEVGVWLDGAMPFRAETVRGYVDGLALTYLADQSQRSTGSATSVLPIDIEARFRYNQSFQSVFAIVPGVITLMLVLIPAITTALGIVREKETGSIANFRSTPVTRLEFLLGKQAPYVAIAFVSFLMLVAIARLLFGVPVAGSAAALVAGAALYVPATTGFGLLMSAFTRTQVAAMFATAIISMIPAINFSGLLVPVSSLSGAGRAIGLSFPSGWFQQISIGTFTKGLGFAELWSNHLALVGFGLAFIAAATLALRKQEP
jgi:ribosome-dependent ATPase